MDVGDDYLQFGYPGAGLWDGSPVRKTQGFNFQGNCPLADNHSRLCPGQFDAIDPAGLGGQRDSLAYFDGRHDAGDVAVEYECLARDWWLDFVSVPCRKS